MELLVHRKKLGISPILREELAGGSSRDYVDNTSITECWWILNVNRLDLFPSGLSPKNPALLLSASTNNSSWRVSPWAAASQSLSSRTRIFKNKYLIWITVQILGTITWKVYCLFYIPIVSENRFLNKNPVRGVLGFRKELKEGNTCNHGSCYVFQGSQSV